MEIKIFFYFSFFFLRGIPRIYTLDIGYDPKKLCLENIRRAKQRSTERKSHINHEKFT